MYNLKSQRSVRNETPLHHTVMQFDATDISKDYSNVSESSKDRDLGGWITLRWTF
jgi:hypothetical protein